MYFLPLGYIYLFFNLLNFYSVTRFLVTPLLVTRYCVTLFNNTRRAYVTENARGDTRYIPGWGGAAWPLIP